MSSEYYFEVHRKSYEFEQNFDHPFKENTAAKLSPDNYESASENLLTDYEVVSSEEIDETNDNNKRSEPAKVENFALTNAAGSGGRLHLRLSAEKIALKSQTQKIDKSIEPETEICHSNSSKQSKDRKEKTFITATTTTSPAAATITFCHRHRRAHQQQAQKPHKFRQQQQQQQQHQHAPIAFTILPVNMAQRPPCDKRADNGRDLPEIVLTSNEQRAATRFNKSTPPTNIKSSAGAVSFQTARNSTSAKIITEFPSPPPPIPAPPPRVQSKVPITTTATTRTNTAAVKQPEVIVVVEKFEHLPEVGAAKAAHDKLPDAEDNSNSEINSQPGSSTSPESLMDNILSAASSVSVRSSSLSSGGTEMAKIAANVTKSHSVSGPYIDGAVVLARNAGGGGGGGGGVGGGGGIHAAHATTKEIPVNRALNSKSNELKVLSLHPVPLSPAGTLTPLPTPTPTPTPTSTPALLHATPTLSEPRALQPPAFAEANANRSRSPSPSPSVTIRITPDPTLFPEDLKCVICADVFRDPRTLNCLHSFCFQCLVDENFKQDSSIPFWSQPGADDHDWKGVTLRTGGYSARSSSPEISTRSGSASPSRPRQASFSFKRKKSLDRLLLKPKSDGKSSESSSSLRLNHMPDERRRSIFCKVCKHTTELPVGGIRQLPQNFLIVRKIEAIKQKMGDEVISRVWCSLCFEETNATYHCSTCTLNMCTLCKESHERQRPTANHRIRNIMELRRARKQQQSMLDDNAKFSLKCGMHPGFEMKSFCCTCLQIACTDCLVLLHKGHKHEPIAKAFSSYSKILRDSAEQARPLCNYAEHCIERMNEIAKRINSKCDEVHAEVETFMKQYYQAVEVHRKTLLQQVHRARESKVEMILEQQLDLEKRNSEAMEAIRFSQELSNVGSDVELLAFLNILLKRFEYCQQFKAPIDPKISDSLHFLPEIRAPSTKAQNDIPLFGIITMQTVDPSLCTLQWEGFSHLRLHKRVELLLLSRDADGVPLCHGGLQINALVKYKDSNTKFLPVEVADNRDGTYGIGFTPDSPGTVILTVTINDKPIKGNPFSFLARTVRPHSGIYHCCAFCSSKGNKLVKCSCDGRMPGYNGCGHGHKGHPGSRHWSCCGNILENSECNVANKLLNP